MTTNAYADEREKLDKEFDELLELSKEMDELLAKYGYEIEAILRNGLPELTYVKVTEGRQAPQNQS